MALVSAHRGGAGHDRAAENTLAAYESAIAVGCDYVEFDVRLTADDRAVLFHDAEHHGDDGPRIIARHRYDDIAYGRLLELDTVLEAIAGRIKAHVDLKVRGAEVLLVSRIVGSLGVDNVIITTAEDASVRDILRWSREHAPGLLVGLSSSQWSTDGRMVPRWRSRLSPPAPPTPTECDVSAATSAI